MKFWNYIVMLTTMIIFLEFLGLPTGLGTILRDLGISIGSDHTLISGDIASSSLFSRIFGSTGILVLVIGAGSVVIGFFAKSYDVSLVVAPFISFVGTLYISTFWGLILYVQTFNQAWLTALIALIFVPLGAGFVISCVDYFKGSAD